MPTSSHPNPTPSALEGVNVTPFIRRGPSTPEPGRGADALRAIEIREGLDTVKEFCAFFRISKTTFYKLVKEGHIRPLKIGRRTLVPRSDHEHWIFRMPQPALFTAVDLAG